VSTPRAWTRPRFFLALLLAALVVGVVPVRLPAARGDKASGTAAWRAAAARSVAARPDLDLRGAPPLPAFAAETLPLPRIVRAGDPPAPRVRPTAPASARSPLPRAPPVA
jgi:hypothetical protein